MKRIRYSKQVSHPQVPTEFPYLTVPVKRTVWTLEIGRRTTFTFTRQALPMITADAAFRVNDSGAPRVRDKYTETLSAAKSTPWQSEPRRD
jgi:hypothetical protein